MDAQSTAPESRRHWLPAFACGLICSLVAIAPHLAMAQQYQRLEYLAGGDDIIYLAVTRSAYYGEGRLRDPYCNLSQHVPTAFSPFQFVPIADPLARLGVPFLLLPLIWRFIGGLLAGAAAYALSVALIGPRRFQIPLAVGLALLLINDAGTITGRPGIDTLRHLREWMAGTYSLKFADGVGQYRIVNPLLNYPWLFIVIALIFSDCRRPRHLLLAGVCLGICTLTYFFFWTGLVGALAIYGVIQFLRWRLGQFEARGEFLFVAGVIAIGLAIGGYQIASNSLTFADPSFRAALDRTSLGYRVPHGDPIRTQYLRSVLVLGVIAVAAAMLAVRWSRRLLIAASLALAGYLLRNSAVITGLEFENYHWSYIQNLGIMLVTLELLLRLLPDRRGVALVVFALGISIAVFAFGWRWREVRLAPETIESNTTLNELLPLAPAIAKLGPDTALAGPFQCNIAILLSRCGELYCLPHTSHRSLIPDDEVHQRHAANAWLQGLTEAEYAKIADGGHSFSMTASPHPHWQPEAVAQVRLAHYRAIAANPSLIEQFHADAVLSPVGGPPPPGANWVEAARTDRWILRTKAAP